MKYNNEPIVSSTGRPINVKILRGQYKSCYGITHGRIDDRQYMVEIPFGCKLIKELLTSQEITSSNFREESEMITNNDKFFPEFAQPREKIALFTIEELMTILNQDKPSDEILMDLKDHITN